MGEEETKEPPITHTLAELRNFVDCLVKDNRIILIEDPDHNDGRFYTFLETQLKCLEANTAKHICVEAGHDYNSRFKKFKKTGKTSYLDPFGEYSTEFGAARSRAIRNLVVATEETGITIHATDAADKDESAESLAASKYLDDYDKAHPELNGKPPRGNKEYTKAQSVEHKYRMKENPRIADRIASIAEAYPTEKIVVIIGRGHVRGGSLDLKKLLQNHPKLRGQKIVQIGTDKSVPKNDLAFLKNLDFMMDDYETTTDMDRIMANLILRGGKKADALIGLPEENKLRRDMRALDGISERQKAREMEFATNKLIYLVRHKTSPVLPEKGEGVVITTSKTTERGGPSKSDNNVVEQYFEKELGTISGICRDCTLEGLKIDDKEVARIERKNITYDGKDSRLASYEFYDRADKKTAVFKKHVFAKQPEAQAIAVKEELAFFNNNGSVRHYVESTTETESNKKTTISVKQSGDTIELLYKEQEKGKPAKEAKRIYSPKELFEKAIPDATPISCVPDPVFDSALALFDLVGKDCFPARFLVSEATLVTVPPTSGRTGSGIFLL